VLFGYILTPILAFECGFKAVGLENAYVTICRLVTENGKFEMRQIAHLLFWMSLNLCNWTKLQFTQHVSRNNEILENTE